MPSIPFVPAAPLYEGASVNSEVPSRYPVALAGRGLFVDWAEYNRETLAMLRPPTDQARRAGGQSRNNEGFWVAAGNDWRKGAGQRFYDREDSDLSRFRTSRGVNPWARGEAGLHFDTEEIDAASATNLQLLPAGDYVYKVEGTTLTFSSSGDPGTFTNAVVLTGIAAGGITGITTDGTNVYVCDGANVWVRAIGSASAGLAASSTENAERIWYANGRLLAGVANALKELDATGAATATIKTHANTGFRWLSACGAPNGIYVAGRAGNVSEIYHVDVNTSTGALLTPYSAAPWPNGEAINVVDFYAGFVFIGSSLGYRAALIGGDNSLEYGSLTEIDGGVNAFTFEGRYAWFTWTNFDDDYTGLGRIDLGQWVDADVLVFAYASDLMVLGQGTVLDVTRFASETYIAVSALGVYRQSANLVATAYLKTGWIDYDDVEDKVAVGVGVRHDPLAGTIGVSIEFPDGSTRECGTSSTASSTKPDTFGAGQIAAQRVELTFSFTRDAGTATAGPKLTLWKLLSSPTGVRVDEIIVPFDVRESVNGVDFNPLEVFQWLKGLERDGQPVPYQEGSATYTVLVDKVLVDPTQPVTVDGSTFFNGRIPVRLLTLEL